LPGNWDKKLSTPGLRQRIGFIRNTLTAPVNEWDADSDEYKCDIVMGVPAGYDFDLNHCALTIINLCTADCEGRGWDDIKDAAQLPGCLCKDRKH